MPPETEIADATDDTDNGQHDAPDCVSDPWQASSQAELFNALMRDEQPTDDGAGKEPAADLEPATDAMASALEPDPAPSEVGESQAEPAGETMPAWAETMVGLYQAQQQQMAAMQDVLRGQSELLARLNKEPDAPQPTQDLDLSRLLAAGLKAEYGAELAPEAVSEVARALSLSHLAPEWGDNDEVKQIADRAMAKARSRLHNGTAATSMQAKLSELEAQIAELKSGAQRPVQRAEFGKRLANAALREQQYWPNLAKVVGDDGAAVVEWLEHNGVDSSDQQAVLKSLSSLELDLGDLAGEIETHGVGPYKAALQRARSPLVPFVDALAPAAAPAATTPPAPTGDKPPQVSRRKNKAGGVTNIPTADEQFHRTDDINELFRNVMRVPPGGGAPN